jgi:hypothetical protein
MIVDVWKCPLCKSELQSSGVIVANDQECSVFQCDDCVVVKPVFGEPFDVALTFAVNDAGEAFDPVDDEVIG